MNPNKTDACSSSEDDIGIEKDRPQEIENELRASFLLNSGIALAIHLVLAIVGLIIQAALYLSYRNDSNIMQGNPFIISVAVLGYIGCGYIFLRPMPKRNLLSVLVPLPPATIIMFLLNLPSAIPLGFANLELYYFDTSASLNFMLTFVLPSFLLYIGLIAKKRRL